MYAALLRLWQKKSSQGRVPTFLPLVGWPTSRRDKAVGCPAKYVRNSVRYTICTMYVLADFVLQLCICCIIRATLLMQHSNSSDALAPRLCSMVLCPTVFLATAMLHKTPYSLVWFTDVARYAVVSLWLADPLTRPSVDAFESR